MVSIKQTLPSKISIRLPVHHIARTILEFLVQLRVEISAALLHLYVCAEGGAYQLGSQENNRCTT
jgi:hypothetical protein